LKVCIFKNQNFLELRFKQEKAGNKETNYGWHHKFSGDIDNYRQLREEAIQRAIFPMGTVVKKEFRLFPIEKIVGSHLKEFNPSMGGKDEDGEKKDKHEIDGCIEDVLVPLLKEKKD